MTNVVGAACTPPPAGIVSWRRGEGNANDAYNLNNGTFEGTAAYVSGKVNQAFRFNGTDGDVKVPASGSLDVGTSGNGVTLDAWIKPDSVTSQQPLIEWNNGTGGIGVHMWISVGAPFGAGPAAFTPIWWMRAEPPTSSLPLAA